MSINPTYDNHRLKHAILVISVSSVFIVLILGMMYFFSKDNLIFGIALLILPIPIFYLYWFFSNPRVGFYSVLVANYFAIGLSRYIPAPLGLSLDGLLVMTWLAVIFSQFNKKVEWKKAGRDYSYFVIIWYVMTFMQLFNPEAVSREAWFYVMRGQALYIFLTVPLVFLIFNKPKDIDILLQTCAWFTLIAIAKGIGQKYMGVDRWEQTWLNVPGNRSTHILFGQLRVFSIYSDAGTFGSSMGYFGVMFIVLGIHEIKKNKKFFYFLIGLLSIFAMLISGTRSAIAVPLVGFAVYTVLTKKIKIMVTVGTIIFVVFFILKYTNIGQGNYDIRRMRSAFGEQNASMDVRSDNRKIFADYLRTRPFGGGVGSSGNWGLRFSPGTILAETATDGFYIQIWAEQGIVGLTFYLIMIFYFALKSTFLIFFRLKKPKNIFTAIAFTCGMYGLMVSSYTASSLGQLPNIIIVFTSMALISLMPEWEKEEEKLLKEKSLVLVEE
jgi:O-Antigen ligase